MGKLGSKRQKFNEIRNWALNIQLVDSLHFWFSSFIFCINFFICPDCGGEMKIISVIQEREVIDKILKHLDLLEEHIHSPPNEEYVSELTYVPIYD